MNTSKNVALAFLFGALLVGGALGFSADRLTANHGPHRNRSARTMMVERLGLTPEQANRVDSVVEDRHRQFRALLAPLQPQMDSIRVRSRDQIRAVLTPEQLVKFETLVREMSDTTRAGRD